MEITLDTVRKLIIENADYVREIEHLHDLIENRDGEVDVLRAELAQLKMPAAA